MFPNRGTQLAPQRRRDARRGHGGLSAMKYRARLSATRVARRIAESVFGVLAVGVIAAPITAQDGRDGASSGDARSCIPLNDIDRTSVIDDNTILFYGRGHDDVYRNDLPRSCPELRNEERFMYRVSLAQLCSNDTITVLEDAG